MDFNNDICEKCKKNKFNDYGIALKHGIKFFTCINCKEKSATFAEGQDRVCHACARKLGMCVMCGERIEKK